MLGLAKSPNLTWNAHIEEAGKKASERFYLLRTAQTSEIITNRSNSFVQYVRKVRGR